MKDLKTGTKITLEIVEGDDCISCFFKDICYSVKCKLDRADGKNIIFKEIKS